MQKKILILWTSKAAQFPNIIYVVSYSLYYAFWTQFLLTQKNNEGIIGD